MNNHFRKAKNKPLPLVQKVPLIVAGYRDGRAGVVQYRDEKWTSPRLAYMASTYESAAAKAWLNFQVRRKETYAQIEELQKLIPEEELKLKKLKEDDDELLIYRRHGEEQLPPEVVKARREKEMKTKKEKRLADIQMLGSGIAQRKEEITALKEKVKQDRFEVELGINQLKEEVNQRAAVYLQAALRRRPEQITVPANASLAFINSSETLFKKQHKED